MNIDLERRAAVLREAFDKSFATPPQQTREDVLDLLMIRIANEPYAIALQEIRGIVTKRPVVELPAGAAHLLGLVGVRGEIMPAYCLASLLAYPEHTDRPTWMVLCGEAQPIALGFAHFEGYLRLPLSQRHLDDEPRAARPYVTQLVRTDVGVSAVISISNIVAAVRSRHQTTKER